jgi:hypothetical protein
MSSVGEFSSEDHFPTGIVDNGYPRGFAPWINLDVQRLKERLLHSTLEDKSERIPFEYRCFAR